MALPPPRKVLTDLDRERIEAAIRDTCSASLMSDTKWRKLVAIVETVPSIQGLLGIEWVILRDHSGGNACGERFS